MTVTLNHPNGDEWTFNLDIEQHREEFLSTIEFELSKGGAEMLAISHIYLHASKKSEVRNRVAYRLDVVMEKSD